MSCDPAVCSGRPSGSGVSHPVRRWMPAGALALLSALTLFFALPQDGAEAQGFSFYQHSACSMARAGAAVALPCGDGSAIFYNPAALAEQEGWAGSMGAVGVFSHGDFTDDRTRSTTSLESDPRIAPHLYLTYGVNERLAAGIGVYAPYGFGTEWHPEFQGSFLSFDSSLDALYIQPTLSYQLHERLAVGAGLTVALSQVELNRRMDISRQLLPGVGVTFAELGIPPGTPFAEANLASDWATGVGGHLGIQGRIGDRLHVGARFLTPVELDYEGTGSFQPVETGRILPPQNPFNVPGGTPLDALVAASFTEGPLTEQSITTRITLPAQLAIGMGLHVTPELMVSLDYQWVNWSSFESVEIQFEESFLNQTLAQNYRDAGAVRVGAEYDLGEGWLIRGGYLYNQAASPPETVTPLVPEGERNHLTAGLGWEVRPGVRLSGGYHYLMQNDRRGRTSDPADGSLPSVELNDGLYTVGAHIVGFTVSLER